MPLVVGSIRLKPVITPCYCHMVLNLCLGVSLKILACSGILLHHVAASILRWFIILFIIVMWCVSAVFSHFFPKAQSVAISVSESRRGCCQAGSTDEMWSGAGRRRAIGSDQARGWARVWSASPSADWTCHPAGVVPASYPADDYSVSKLTLCWTFLSPTICVSTVGKKEVDDWADYQKLFFAFRGRWPILPHIFILLRLIFILIEKHRSKYFRPNTNFHTCCVEANIWSFHCVHETYVLPSWLLNLRIVAVIKLVFWLSYFIWPWNCEHEYFLQLGENSWLIYFFFHWSLFLIWPWRVWGRVIVYPPSWMFVAPVWICVALMRGLVCRSWKYLSP